MGMNCYFTSTLHKYQMDGMYLPACLSAGVSSVKREYEPHERAVWGKIKIPGCSLCPDCSRLPALLPQSHAFPKAQKGNNNVRSVSRSFQFRDCWCYYFNIWTNTGIYFTSTCQFKRIFLHVVNVPTFSAYKRSRCSEADSDLSSRYKYNVY